MIVTGAEIEAQAIGQLREISVKFLPGFLGKFLRVKMKTMVFRHDGREWVTFPAGTRVEPAMAVFLENAWKEHQAQANPPG